jgi:hypothetical protein
MAIVLDGVQVNDMVEYWNIRLMQWNMFATSNNIPPCLLNNILMT